MSWPILTVKDTDGKPYYYTAPTMAVAQQMHRKHSRQAEMFGCKLREVPVLTSRDPGPFVGGVKIKRNADGAITQIDWTNVKPKRGAGRKPPNPGGTDPAP